MEKREINQPSETARQTNIKAGQAALRRCKTALIKAGIKLPRQKDVPLYFGCEDSPGWMICELNGKRTIGRFIKDKFIPKNNIVHR